MKKVTAYVENTNAPIVLDDRSFIYEGGEGAIFGKNNTAYKIYLDYTKVLPVDKVTELSVLTNDNIIKPIHFLVDDKNKKIGYTMRWVKETNPLVCLFTKGFKQRNNVSYDQCLALVKDLQNLISFIHSKNILVVDLNEMNFLVDKNFKEIYAIDVNSYQTKTHPATAIAENIRDYHTKGFDKNSDWFSFGVVSFQVLTGIHPYKGSNSRYSGPKLEQFKKRMLDNVSVFDKDSHYPPSVEPFSNIPVELQNWYKAVFQDGKRLPPPLDYKKAIIITTVQEILKGKFFDIIKEFELDELPQRIINVGNDVFYSTKNYYYINEKRFDKQEEVLPVLGTKLNKLFLFSVKDNKIICTNQMVNSNITVEKLFVIDNRLYYKLDEFIFEVDLMELGSVYKLLPKEVAKVMPNSTQIFESVLIQNVLGNYHAVFFPESGKNYTVKLDDLKGYKIIDAKYKGNILAVIRADKNGKKDKLTYKFSSDFKEKELTIEPDEKEINFTVNQNGIYILLNSEDEIEFAYNKIGSKVTKIKDPAIDSSCTIFNRNSKMMFVKGRKVYRFNKI